MERMSPSSPGPSLSTSEGILELGFMLTKPDVNWAPSPILILHASYCRPTASASSSSTMLTCTAIAGLPTSARVWRWLDDQAAASGLVPAHA